MSDLANAMWRQAQRDLEHARVSQAAGHYEWAGFSAQQAAEKALKAMLLASGHRAPPVHSLDTLFQLTIEHGLATEADRATLAQALLGLTQTWAIARYPLAGMDTAPADLFTPEDATAATARAQAIVDFARERGAGP